jgi:DNA-binding winged helix-turn-helix (wHTH) protein/tetratricopeptide (TPR) repeat protein
VPRLLYEFGPFSLDPTKRLLMRQGHMVPVPPRALDVLIALIETRGALVDKDTLLTTVWDEAVVEENNLSVSISALRKALGESFRDHRYIVTVPRRGYSFVAAVTERNADEAAPSRGAGAAARLRSQVLVTPFAVIGDRRGEAVEEFVQASFHDIGARLGNSHHLEVVTRAHAGSRDHEPAALGRRIGVEYVLSGTFRLDPTRVRVITRLLRAADGASVWGQSFEESVDDLFGAEGRIVERICHGLVGHFEEDLRQRSARRHTESAEAHRDYVRGRFFWDKRTEEGLRKAIEHFERAIHTDPGYALPYAGLADCFNLLSTYGAISPRQGVPRAIRAATRALEIDDTLAEAYTSLGYARFAYYWNWEQAEADFRRAIQLNPDYSTGYHLFADHLAAAGRFDEALASLERALALQPMSLIINTDIAWVLFHARRWAQGIDQLKKTLEMDGRFPAARWVLGLTWLAASEPDRAVEELETARTLAPHSPHILGALAQALGVARRSGDARAVLRQLRDLGRRNYVSPYHHAVAHVGANARDAAIRELRQAVSERAHWVAYFRVTPTLDAIREHAGFIRLIQQVAPLKG